jgi:alpha-1,2-mannosyltransferase
MGGGTAAVLTSLAKEPGRARHGLDLARDAGLSSGALYPALIRLQRAGRIEAHWSDGRRAYRLTPPAASTPPARIETEESETPRNKSARTETAGSENPHNQKAWTRTAGSENPRNETARTETTRSETPRNKTARTETPGIETRRNAHRVRTAVLWLPAALAALITAWAVLGRPAHVRLSDLGVYTGAVDGLRNGASLYDFMSAGNAPFTYPPFAGLLFLPLADVPTLTLQLTWTLATIATVAGLALLLGGQHRRAPAYALVLMVSAPVSSDLKYGQVSLFLAVLVTVDVLALRHSRVQGVLIGVAAAIKLTPLIFIPMLWFAGRRRAALVATATFGACGALAGIALPADSWRFWTTEVSHVSRLGYITSVGNQSLNGALMRFELPAPARSMIVLVLGGAVAAIALHRAARLGRGGDWLSALVLVGSASVVLSPVSWTHHQVWLVLAALLPVRGPIWARRAWPTLALAVMLLPVTALGPPLWSNSRLVLAISIAALLPLSWPQVGAPVDLLGGRGAVPPQPGAAPGPDASLRPAASWPR